MIAPDNVTTKRTNIDTDRSGVHVTTLDIEIAGGTSEGPVGHCLVKFRPELGRGDRSDNRNLTAKLVRERVLPRPMQSTSGTRNASTFPPEFEFSVQLFTRKTRPPPGTR